MADLNAAVHLESGQIYQYDFRSPETKSAILTPPPPNTPISQLKVIQWNIERGYKLDAIIETLRSFDADILALQEIDCGLSRSEFIETGIAIAQSLGLNYVFQAEFHELQSNIDKQYFIDTFQKQTPEQASKYVHDSLQAYAASLPPNVSPEPHINPSINRPNIHHYQTDYKKAYIPYNDTIHQYHPTPFPTTNTFKYKQYTVPDDIPGVHGNCILTKFNISQCLQLQHQHHPYNWTRDGALLNEPRIGQRQTLCAVIDIPTIRYGVIPVVQTIHEQTATIQQHLHSTTNPSKFPQVYVPISQMQEELRDDIAQTIPVAIYTCHLELFCGLTDRLKILSEIFAHFRQHFYYPTQGHCHSMLLGDFNSLAHSIARFSPKYCKDEFRWKSLGYTEAEWWYKYIFDTYHHDSILSHNIDPTHSNTSNNSLLQNQPLKNLNIASMTSQDLINLANPGFTEPSPSNMITLTNYKDWFYGKLDWVLLFQSLVTYYRLFNIDYTASDHRGIYFECVLPISTHATVIQRLAPTLRSSVQTHLININKVEHTQHLIDQLTTDTYQRDTKQSYIRTSDTFIPSKSVIISGKGNVAVILQNQIAGYNQSNNGFNGWRQRNCTPFVKQIAWYAASVGVAAIAVATLAFAPW